MNETYEGLKAFQRDEGTLWFPKIEERKPLDITSIDKPSKEIKRNVKSKKPIIWVIDDEKENRDWFVNLHRDYIYILTFSCESCVLNAVKRKIPCDAVVTDIFFPNKSPSNDDEANKLLAIYNDIDESLVKELGQLWREKYSQMWKLDGFTIAKYFYTERPKIPVFLYSRKATWLLNIDELIRDFPIGLNTYWLMEKPKPDCSAEISRQAAVIQRDRILGTLQNKALWWQKILKSVGIDYGPFSVSIDKMLN